MNAQQPQYEQFIQLGLSILDKCDPESQDAARINKQLDEINKSWDKLQGKLAEREATLKDALDLATKFYETLEKLSEWLPEMSDKVDGLQPISSQPDIIQQQKDEALVRDYNNKTIIKWHKTSHTI